MAIGQRMLPVRRQGIGEDFFDSLLELRIAKHAVIRLAEINPIGAPVGGSGVFGRIHKGLDKHRAISVLLHPVVSYLFCGERENMTGKIRNLNPRKNQKPIIADNEVKQLLSMLFLPSNPFVSMRHRPSGRRRKKKTAALS